MIVIARSYTGLSGILLTQALKSRNFCGAFHVIDGMANALRKIFGVGVCRRRQPPPFKDQPAKSDTLGRPYPQLSQDVYLG
jgi:hypothetical protein